MAYNALSGMKDKNRADFGIENSVRIPDLPRAKRTFGNEALAFVRDNCSDL